MSNFDEKHVVKELGERILKNLSAIQGLRNKDGHHEVYDTTQLLAAMHLIFITPKEVAPDKIPLLTIQDMKNQGYCDQIIRSLKKTDTLCDLIRFFRNSLAHCKFNIVTDSNNKIIKIRFWSFRKNKKSGKIWNATLSLDEIHETLRHVSKTWETMSETNLPAYSEE